MSAASGIGRLPRAAAGWIDDRLNPIVVKELRQAVQSRFVVTMILLLLTVLMFVLGWALVEQEGRRGIDGEAGAELFMVFQSILLSTCMLFVPIYVAVRLAAERSSATADLLYVTTIRPSSIVWGKLLAGLVVTGLILSACAPFMVITYLLRGIDLPTVLFVVGIDVLVVLAAAQVAIFVAALPVGWPIKSLLGLGLLWVAGMGFAGMSFFISYELLGVGVGSALGKPDFWLGLLVSVVFWLLGVGLVFFLCVAMIAPATSNRALAPRLYLTLLWLVSFAAMVVLGDYWSDGQAMVVWLGFAVGGLTVAAITSASERETLGPRMRRAVPRRRWLRPVAFVFYSGVGGGLVWVTLLWAGSILGAWLAYEWIRGGGSSAFGSGASYSTHWTPDEWWRRNVSAACWVMGYLLLAVCLCRRVLRFKNSSTVTGVTGLLLMCLASIGPMVFYYVQNPRSWDMQADQWLLLNPLGPLFCNDDVWRGRYGYLALPMSIGFVGLMLLINLGWLWRQWRQFRPMEAGPASPGDAAVTGPPALAEKSAEEIAAMTQEPGEHSATEHAPQAGVGSEEVDVERDALRSSPGPDVADGDPRDRGPGLG